MAMSGVKIELTEKDKEFAIRYVEESGFYKTRLADFLEVSRPTLDKILEENPDFFTSLKRADAVFCKNLIDVVRKKTPTFILRTKYREEFNDTLKFGFDPEAEIQRIKKIIDEGTTKEIEHLE
ncbi:MAG: hypothetical protein A3F30_02475 [Candidatus Levybacteria bacterium RIFCSPHIGHO2_12_FULL_37_12]|nr:MAG: hypothetical protein A3C97_02035 [Candidatus Levybacteria bacterium RIFCSPHIGHO2_02_FULL_37_11]OGH29544.1 MAG: hypothetical protein A3F30_02475 [Candidatus Levybacteria bacterium RIFCSPHIGHO2_12_FULL_37_12]